MKKIVFLINTLDSGGAERVVSLLLDRFIEKYDCYLILIHNNIFYKIDKRVKIINLNDPIKQSGLKKLINLIVLTYKLINIIKENDFRQIVSFLTRSNYINVLSSKITKHKAIINERAMPSIQYNNGIRGIINRILIRIIYSKANKCLSNSYGNMVDLKNNFNITKIDYIYNLFDIDTIKELSKNDIEIKKRRFTFVTVGRLDNGKNHRLIIEAMKSIEADLWIIGDGELREELLSYIKELNLNDKVYLLGKKENPFAFLAKADCFVFTSNHEGFPNVLVEALACSLPVISTDCKSGPREILSPKSNFSFQLKDDIELAEYGVLTPINDLYKLNKAMSMILIDKKLRENYKNKSKERSNNFDINKLIKEYEDIICMS